MKVVLINQTDPIEVSKVNLKRPCSWRRVDINFMHFRYFSSEQTFRSIACNVCNDLCAQSNASLDKLHICKAKPRLFRYNYAKCHIGITPEWSRKKHSPDSLSFSLVYAIFMYACVFKRTFIRIGFRETTCGRHD